MSSLRAIIQDGAAQTSRRHPATFKCAARGAPDAQPRLAPDAPRAWWTRPPAASRCTSRLASRQRAPRASVTRGACPGSARRVFRQSAGRVRPVRFLTFAHNNLDLPLPDSVAFPCAGSVSQRRKFPTADLTELFTPQIGETEAT